MNRTRSGSPDWSDDDTDRGRLANTQKYLRLMLQKVAPDSVLFQTWDDFYKFYDRLVRRYAYACGLRDGDQVENCVQDVWLYIAEKLQNFQHNGNRHGFRSWLFRLVKSRAIDQMRRRKVRRSESLSQVVDAGREPVDPHPVAEFEHVWEREWVETALEKLREHVSERSFQVFYQIEIEQRSVAEVAAALDLTPQQVTARHCRAMNKLRALMTVNRGEQFDVQK